MTDLRFAFWIPQESVVPRWSHAPAGAANRFEYVKWLTQLAEERGFDYAFAPARSAVGAFAWLDALAVTSALAGVTRRIGLIPTLRPYLRQPRLTAKTIHSIDAISGGRAGVNILATLAGDNFTSYGEMLDHDEQYRRIAEFVRVLRAVWQEEAAAAGSSASPVSRLPGSGSGLPIFQNGNTQAARELAGSLADWCVIEGERPEVVAARIGQVRDAAERAGRDPHAVRFACSGLVVMRESDWAAHADLRDALHRRDGSKPGRPSRGWFGVDRPDAARGADDGLNAPEGTEGWLKSGLIGAEDRVVDRVAELESAGVDLLICGFLNNPNDLPAFAERVIARWRVAAQPMPRSVDPAIRQALGLGG
jgi:FMNH2-dependent dimethyl sulfone monooxygenase